MSSTIEFHRWVLKSGPLGLFGDPMYIGIHEYGESNVFDHHNRIARDVNLLAVERGYEFMKRICEIAVNCEGGCLKLNGRWTKPESFISAWRKAQAGAVLLENYLRQGNLVLEFYSIAEALVKRTGELDSSIRYQRDQISEIESLIALLERNDGVTEEQQQFCGKTVNRTAFVLTLENHIALLELLLDCKGLNIKPVLWRTSFSDITWKMAYEHACRDKEESIDLCG